MADIKYDAYGVSVLVSAQRRMQHGEKALQYLLMWSVLWAAIVISGRRSTVALLKDWLCRLSIYVDDIASDTTNRQIKCPARWPWAGKKPGSYGGRIRQIARGWWMLRRIWLGYSYVIDDH